MLVVTLFLKSSWIKEEVELKRDANRGALKAPDRVPKSAQRKGGKELDIPKGILVLLWDHSKSGSKIQDHYKDQKFIMVDPHLDPNVYDIKPVNGKGPVWSVNFNI